MSAASSLESELGGPSPEALAALDEDERHALADVIHAAKERQSRELQAAVEESLGVVPRLLRGTLRKILFG